MHARKFLFILRLLVFFNEGESFLDECSADCAVSSDTVCLPDHQYCLPLLQNPKSHSQFSHYFIIIVFRKTLAVLLELCYEFQEVAQVCGSDHVSFVFKGRMKDLERNSRVLGIWLGSLVNLNT